MVVWTMQGVCFWEFEAKVEVTKEEKVRGIIDSGRRGRGLAGRGGRDCEGRKYQ